MTPEQEAENDAAGELLKSMLPTPAPATGVDDDVRNIIELLESDEWAEHCTETVLGSRLESEITRLIGRQAPAPASAPDILGELIKHLRNAHAFIENTEAFGVADASGVIQCGGAVWNIDESKEALNACRAAMESDPGIKKEDEHQ